MNSYLKEGTSRHWNKLKRFRPDDGKLNELHNKASHLWDTYCRVFPELHELSVSNPADHIAAKYRHPNGGHLLFRPIGLFASVYVVRGLVDSKNFPVLQAVEQIAQLPMELGHEMWNGLVWDGTNKRMMAASERQSALRKLMFHATGGNLAYLKTDSLTLTRDLAGLLNKDQEEIHLYRIGESG